MEHVNSLGKVLILLLLLMLQAGNLLFGYSRGKLQGKNVNVLMPPPYNARHDSYLKAYLATGETHILDRTREVIALHKACGSMAS